MEEKGTKKKTPPSDEVIKEFPAIGRYRIRVVKSRGAKSLDIREYVTAEKFEGFTRRGIRLSTGDDCEALKNILEEIDSKGLLAEGS